MAIIDNFTVKNDRGEDVSLAAWQGQVRLIVNTASKCGFTPQYEGLQALQRQYGDKGFVVLAFPCNQFGGQEPAADADIQSFCQMRFGIDFPVFAKTDVNGPAAHPLFDYLKAQKPGWLGQKIRWNFTKFLIGRDGAVLRRFGPPKKPAAMASAIEKAIG